MVEEDAQARAVILAALTSRGYEVVEARDGPEALALCEREPDRWPDLVLTDLMTPKMSGRELVRRLIAHHPGLRVLYMSGFADKAVLHEGLIDQTMAFLQKPFTPDALLEKVSGVLDAHLAAGLAGSTGAG